MRKIQAASSLLGGLLLVLDVEVLERVGVLALGEDADPVTQVLLLEELLRQVLEVALAVGHRRRDAQDVFGERDLDLVGQLALAAVELRVLLEELLEALDQLGAEDAIGSGDGAVDLEVLLALRQRTRANDAASSDLSANSDHDACENFFLRNRRFRNDFQQKSTPIRKAKMRLGEEYCHPFSRKVIPSLFLLLTFAAGADRQGVDVARRGLPQTQRCYRHL